jgi:hypothetical protein
MALSLSPLEQLHHALGAADCSIWLFGSPARDNSDRMPAAASSPSPHWRAIRAPQRRPAPSAGGARPHVDGDRLHGRHPHPCRVTAC